MRLASTLELALKTDPWTAWVSGCTIAKVFQFRVSWCQPIRRAPTQQYRLRLPRIWMLSNLVYLP